MFDVQWHIILSDVELVVKCGVCAFGTTPSHCECRDVALDAIQDVCCGHEDSIGVLGVILDRLSHEEYRSKADFLLLFSIRSSYSERGMHQKRVQFLVWCLSRS